MVSSLARFKHLLRPEFPQGVTCTYKEPEYRKDENFPVFTKDLFISVFRPPVYTRGPADGAECDPAGLLQPLDTLSSGRLGKTHTCMRQQLVRQASGAVRPPDLDNVLAVTKMAADHVDYIDAVRTLELFNIKSRTLSPFIIKVLLSFRSRQPYQTEHLYMVSEYWLSGSSLCKRLSELGTLSERDARYYCMQLADAIMSLHEHGKIIRRLCLCHCLLEPNGFLRLAPYSLCQHNLDCGRPCNLLVRQCGDQFYASPECVFGVDVQAATDWWSFGVILFELVTGKPPFTGRTLGELGKAITEADPCVPLTTSPECAALIKHLLHKDPRRRLGWGDTLTQGHASVRGHPWFCGASWADVRDTNNLPPYRPLDDDKAILPQRRGERKRDIIPPPRAAAARESCVKPRRPARQAH